MSEDQRDKLLKRLKKQADTGGRAAAINYKCAECIYSGDANGEGSWRKQVESCSSYGCPLYKFRPMSTNNKDDD